jgi:hypothetical protein
LKNINKVPINEDNFDYKVNIIDNNVNIFTLLPEQSIILNEEDYTIFPIPETINTLIPETTDTPISDTINNDEHSSISSDKSDDFVKLEADS